MGPIPHRKLRNEIESLECTFEVRALHLQTGFTSFVKIRHDCLKNVPAQTCCDFLDDLLELEQHTWLLMPDFRIYVPSEVEV